MKTIKMKGKTVDEAVEGALAVLGAKREDVDVNVLNEGKGGVLGVFGGEEAEVEVKLKTEAAEEAKIRLQEILDKMGFVSLVSAKKEGELVKVEIKGDDLGRIIGKEGATLEALQVLLSSMLSKSAKQRVRVLADAAGYREKRAKKTEQMAKEAAEKAEKTGKEVVLPPMPASERRLVHLYIQERAGVESFSKGERDGRRVVVVPKERAREIIERGDKEEFSMEEGSRESEERKE